MMKNYSELSDFEINSAVHNATMTNPYKIEFLGNNKIRWIRGETDVITDMVPYGKTTLRDYCNNQSDAWPIIIDNHITIINDSDCTRMAVSNTDDFYDENVRTGVGYYQEWNENGLRAAMIVYLMMKDGENEN